MATSVRKRRRFSAQFKARVALEAVREQKTIAQLAGQYQVHPNQISEWKRQLLQGAEELFAGRRDRVEQDHEALTARLCEQIGKLKVELDWLQKKSWTG